MASFSSLVILLVAISSLLAISYSSYAPEEVRSSVPLVKGLSWNFHSSKCPRVEIIIRQHLKKVFKNDIGQAAGLLRLHFHDCFVQVKLILCIYIYIYMCVFCTKQIFSEFSVCIRADGCYCVFMGTRLCDWFK